MGLDVSVSSLEVPIDGFTGAAPDTAAITTTDAEFLAANTNRVGIVLTNLGNMDVYISFGSNTAVVGSGVVIEGGSVIIITPAFGAQEALRGIVNASTSNLAIQEFER